MDANDWDPTIKLRHLKERLQRTDALLQIARNNGGGNEKSFGMTNGFEKVISRRPSPGFLVTENGTVDQFLGHSPLYQLGICTSGNNFVTLKCWNWLKLIQQLSNALLQPTLEDNRKTPREKYKCFSVQSFFVSFKRSKEL